MQPLRHSHCSLYTILDFPKQQNRTPSTFPGPDSRSNLLLLLLGLVVDDVVEAELVHTAGGGDDTQPVTELLLLEELLGPIRNEERKELAKHVCGWTRRRRNEENLQVLQVPTRERNMRHDLDLAVTGLRDLDVIPEIANTTLDLDAVMQELLERRDVEDLVTGGPGGVDHEL